MSIPAATNTQIDDVTTHDTDLMLWMHAGSTYTSGSTSTTLRPNVNANRAAGVSSIFASTSNFIEITGIQLEVGVATPFEHEELSTTLAKCQRYFIDCKSQGSGYGGVAMFRSVYANQAEGYTGFPVEMRATPTVTLFDGSSNTGALTENGAAHNRGCAAGNISKVGFNKATSDGTGTGHFSTSAGAGSALLGTYQAAAEL